MSDNLSKSKSVMLLSIALGILLGNVQANIYKDASGLFRSDVRSFYKTDELFESHVNQFLSKTVNSPDPTQKQKRHAYLVKMPEDCQSACHDILRNQFQDQYNTINAEYAMVLSSHETLSGLKELHNTKFVDFKPMLPDMKVDRILKHDVCSLKKADDKNKQVMARIALFYHPQQEFFETLKQIKAVFNKYDGKVALDRFNFPPQPKNIHLTLLISDCAIVKSLAHDLSLLSEIFWVEYTEPLTLHNRWSKGLSDSGVVYETPLMWANFTGYGEVIGTADTGIDTMNYYFHDPEHSVEYQFTASPPVLNYNHRKIIQYYALADKLESPEGHGSHVNGIAAGKPYSTYNYGDYQKFEGVSPDAKIAFVDMGQDTSTGDSLKSVDISSDLLTVMRPSGARIFSFSFGTTGINYYDSQAHSLDHFLWYHPDSLVFVSAGNSGPTLNTVTTPSVAKNCMSVGASGNDHLSWLAVEGSNMDSKFNKQLLAYFSSRGPTADNRLKPDITAPGYWITSALGVYNSSSPFIGYQILDGTSMASPHAASYALKIKQYYNQGYYPYGYRNDSAGFTPSGALIKATMIAAARNLSYTDVYTSYSSPDFSNAQFSTLTTYPSVYQGYGRFQLSKVLNFGESSRNPLTFFVVGSANVTTEFAVQNREHYAYVKTPNQVVSYTFTTSSDPGAIRVVLCWTDPPGPEGSSSAMINTLSLTVTQGGTTLTPYLASGTITSNVQVIDIASPAASTTYTVNVKATVLITKQQPFALVVVSDQITYTNATNTDTETFSPHYKYMSQSTIDYIIFLSISVFFLLIFCCIVRKYTHKKGSLLLDPSRFGLRRGGRQEEQYDFDIDEETGEVIQIPKENQRRGFFGWGKGKPAAAPPAQQPTRAAPPAASNKSTPKGSNKSSGKSPANSAKSSGKSPSNKSGGTPSNKSGGGSGKPGGKPKTPNNSGKAKTPTNSQK